MYWQIKVEISQKRTRLTLPKDTNNSYNIRIKLTRSSTLIYLSLPEQMMCGKCLRVNTSYKNKRRIAFKTSHINSVNNHGMINI